MIEAIAFWGSIFLAFLLVPLMALLGLIWSPIAAAITWRLASNRGLNGKVYATAGAGYSILFLGPWLYLTLRLVGKTPPRWMVSFSYVLLHGVWSGLVFLTGTYGIGTATNLLQEIIYTMLGIAMLALLLLSLPVLLHTRRIKRREGSQVLPNFGYLFPFIGAWVSMATFLTIMQISSPLYEF